MDTYDSRFDFIEKLSFNEAGLIPAITQDWLDGTVLMMAWMNKLALRKTIETGEVHYWSRSRKELWHKGETSGHTQFLRGLRFDCDSDAILLTVEQKGNVSCHKGFRSCFYKDALKASGEDFNDLNFPADACSNLFNVLETRKSEPVSESYTNKLLNGGENLILKKIGEESAEFVMACKDGVKTSIANEAVDLIYHIQVALVNHGVQWQEVLKVLFARRGAKRRS